MMKQDVGGVGGALVVADTVHNPIRSAHGDLGRRSSPILGHLIDKKGYLSGRRRIINGAEQFGYSIVIKIAGAYETLIGRDRTKRHPENRHYAIITDYICRDLPPCNAVPDHQNIGRAAGGTDKVIPGHLIGVSNARIPDRRHHIGVPWRGKEIIDRENGAAVAVGRGVEAKGGSIAEDERRADEVSGLVKALGLVNT